MTITHLVPFAAAISKAVCDNPNTRSNNMAMLRALNAQSLPELINLAKQDEATKAYFSILDVLIEVRLQIIAEDEIEDIMNLKLTYERFTEALSITKHYLLIINS
jgi:hypothetical protein